MNLKRFISLVISIALLLYIYGQIDTVQLWRVFQQCDRLLLLISLGMVIPITFVTAWRLKQLVPHQALGIAEAHRLILGASVLNLVLPSKMGDIAKAYFMGQRCNISKSLALAIAIFEKACDMLALLIWCVFGLLQYPDKNSLFWLMTVGVISGLIMGLLLLSSSQIARFCFTHLSKITPTKVSTKLLHMAKAWDEMHDYFWSNKPKLALISLTSLWLWFLHLGQIWLFILALQAAVPFLISLALAPLSILAGLLPLTFAGVGTRDAALIYFYQNYLDPATGAALGLLCTTRYLLPALIGLPFLNQMLQIANQQSPQTSAES